jgi:hypothetical protein
MTCGELKSRDIRPTLEAMKLGCKFIALLILATLVASCFAAQVGSSTGQLPGQSQPPSGCHEHGSKAPAKAPNHDCCRSGHDAAIMQVHPLRPLDAQFRLGAAASDTLQSTTGLIGLQRLFANLSPTPPGLPALRI